MKVYINFKNVGFWKQNSKKDLDEKDFKLLLVILIKKKSRFETFI